MLADEEDADFGISAPIFVNPSHVLLWLADVFSFVAAPTFESLLKNIEDCAGASVVVVSFVGADDPKLNILENPLNPLSCLVSPVGAELPLPPPPDIGCEDKSFNSVSKLSNSSKSILVDPLDAFFFSFINSSIPVPKLLDADSPLIGILSKSKSTTSMIMVYLHYLFLS